MSNNIFSLKQNHMTKNSPFQSSVSCRKAINSTIPSCFCFVSSLLEGCSFHKLAGQGTWFLDSEKIRVFIVLTAEIGNKFHLTLVGTRSYLLVPGNHEPLISQAALI